jgi:hypothetical protein
VETAARSGATEGVEVLAPARAAAEAKTTTPMVAIIEGEAAALAGAATEAKRAAPARAAIEVVDEEPTYI